MKVSFTSLGGIGEIGMNMSVYETDTSAVIVDCGVKFASLSDFGVDLIIPDFTYLKSIKHKLKCVVLTHAHEDHGGGLPFLLAEYNIPLVAGKFAMDLVDNKLKESKVDIEKVYLSPMEPFQAGDFTLTLVPVTHSIHGSFGLHLEDSFGFNFFHLSDYKADFSPASGAVFSLEHFLSLGDKGLDCFVADSTNSISPGFTRGENEVIDALDRVFGESKGRVFFTTFASNTERIGAVIRLAEKHGRKVALEGSSLLRNIETARRNSLMKISPDTIIPRKQIERLGEDEICVIAAGSQGEQTSVMTKISKGDYGNIIIREGDVFIFSSRIIPGNEQNIIGVMNNIALGGGRCITVNDDKNIHASGHASQEDMKLVLKLLRPKYLIPVHGEHIHLTSHKLLAYGAGLSEDRVLMMSSGKKCVFIDGDPQGLEDIPFGKNYIDSKGGYVLTHEDMKDRKRLVFEGGIFIYVEIDLVKGILKKDPVVGLMGFGEKGNEAEEIASFVKTNVETQLFEKFSKDGWVVFVRKTVKKYLKKTTGRRPVVTVITGDC